MALENLEREQKRLKDGVAKIPREWFQANEWILLAQALGDIAVLVVGAWLCQTQESLIVRTPVWILMAGRIHALGILMHDLVHVKRLNRQVFRKCLLDAVICYPALFNMDYYGLAHHIHHTESNLPGRDPYFVHLHRQNPFGYPIYVLIGSFLLVLVLVFRLLLFPLSLVLPPFRRVFVKYFSQLGASPDPENMARYTLGEGIWIWCLGPTVVWWGICGLLTVHEQWTQFALLYGIPMVLSAALGQLRLACDHIYTEALGNSIVEQVAGATNIEAPWWQNVILGAHATSFHSLHHLVPTLPNYRLRAAHEIMKNCGSEVYEQTIYPGYGSVICKLLKAQWQWSHGDAGGQTPAGAN